MTKSAAEWNEQKSSLQAAHDLIRGEFTPEESLEILDYLIDKKINFHQLKSFSKEIREGVVDQMSVQRCEELKATKASIREMIQLAREQGADLRIRSTLSLEII